MDILEQMIEDIENILNNNQIVYLIEGKYHITDRTDLNGTVILSHIDFEKYKVLNYVIVMPSKTFEKLVVDENIELLAKDDDVRRYCYVKKQLFVSDGKLDFTEKSASIREFLIAKGLETE